MLPFLGGLLFFFLLLVLLRLFLYNDFFVSVHVFILGCLPFNLLEVVAVEETFLLQFLEHLIHSVFVLAGLGTVGNKLESLFNLVSQGLSNLGGWELRETVDTGGDSALVSEITRNFAFVSGSSAANKCRVEQQAVLGGLTLGLQSTEKSLFRTKDLDSRSRVLRQVGEATSMGNQL